MAKLINSVTGKPDNLWFEELRSAVNTLLTVEDWHLIGGTGEPAFENSWENFGDPWDVAAYYKDPSGVVHIKGLVKLGVVDSTMFTLPAKYRPSANQMFCSMQGGTGGAVRLHVLTTGEVKVLDTTVTTRQSLWCSFRV